jgi:hypothetical protein
MTSVFPLSRFLAFRFRASVIWLRLGRAVPLCLCGSLTPGRRTVSGLEGVVETAAPTTPPHRVFGYVAGQHEDRGTSITLDPMAEPYQFCRAKTACRARREECMSDTTREVSVGHDVRSACRVRREECWAATRNQ